MQDDLERMTERTRVRVRRWTAATTLLWVGAAAYLSALTWVYLAFVHPMVHLTIADRSYDPLRVSGLMRGVIYLMEALMVWPVLLLLAAACTIWLGAIRTRLSELRYRASLS